MSRTEALAAASPARQFAEMRRRQAAEIHYRPRQLQAEATILLAAATATLIPATLAAPTQGQPTSLPGALLPLCPAGSHLEPTRMVECLPCRSGVSFTGTANRKTECFECLPCRFITESPCNVTHNTVCRCPSGQYLNVDGGCTILMPTSGSGIENSTKICGTAAIANRDAEGQSCEKECRIWAGLNTALLVLIILLGVTVLITWRVMSRNVNCRSCKWRSNSRRRSAPKDVQDASTEQPLMTSERTESGLSSGMQTDEPTTAQPIATCCDVRSALEKYAAEHIRNKELLEAIKKDLASYPLPRTAVSTSVEQPGQEFASKLDQILAAVGVLQESIKAPKLVNTCLSETPSGSGSDSARQATDVSSQLAQVRTGSSCKAVDSLKSRIKRLAEQSDAANITRVILAEIEAFSENPLGYPKTSTEAKDQEAQDPAT